MYHFAVMCCSQVNLRLETLVSMVYEFNFNLELSRRDDFISLLYLMIFLVNGTLEWLRLLRNQESGYFKKVGVLKNKITVEELCSGAAHVFTEYA